MSGMQQRNVRCAIYTRKSSEEGLEQEFNSLDAQRESCEAYIVSQRHEGWRTLSQMYDDGGLSGATMERPALKRLLADIQANKVDTVVVYKVDRLTRSLSDFARIVDVFDRHGVSFVSVTQSFNTTSSMGRLTLNMLLSFAQFEREVTGERIRDKIAASKKKGLWMGGKPPLGYDVQDRRLIVNESEADSVRYIFRCYISLKSVQSLRDELIEQDIFSKRRINQHGRQSGGKPFTAGALYALLQNPLYIGRVRHKDETYPGRHEAIVDQALWDKAQSILSRNRVERKLGAGVRQPSLLAGLLADATGEAMTPSHACKANRRYRYYVSRSLIKQGQPGRGRAKELNTARRIPAGELESRVEERIIAFFQDRAAIAQALLTHIHTAHGMAAILDRAQRLAETWSAMPVCERRHSLLAITRQIRVLSHTIEVNISSHGLLQLFEKGDAEGRLQGDIDKQAQVHDGGEASEPQSPRNTDRPEPIDGQLEAQTIAQEDTGIRMQKTREAAEAGQAAQALGLSRLGIQGHAAGPVSEQIHRSEDHPCSTLGPDARWRNGYGEPLPDTPEQVLTLTIRAALKRTGIEKRLVIEGSQAQKQQTQPNASLIRLIAKAYAYRHMLLTQQSATITELATQAGVGSSYFTRTLRLGFLAPDIITAILKGKQPPALTANTLAAATHNIPISWQQQRKQFGFT